MLQNHIISRRRRTGVEFPIFKKEIATPACALVRNDSIFGSMPALYYH